MSTTSPLVSATGIWYGYFPEQTQPGDNQSHVLDIANPEAFGNDTLFAAAQSGVSVTHRAVVNVDVHASCKHDVAIERTLGVHVDKSGTILERGQSIFVAGCGNAAYQGILETGQIIKAFASAPGDAIAIDAGYISVSATPI
jgi:hypothetical protein